VLSNSILEVGGDATEGEMLAAIVASLLEVIVVETPIFAVVVLDADAMLGSKGLKACLAAIVLTAELLI
jgi:hypothetical protein